MSMKIVITTAAVLAALAGPALARDYTHKHHAARHVRATAARTNAIGAGFDQGARAAYGRSYDFEAWPTDYLSNRFGDFQMQGRP